MARGRKARLAIKAALALLGVGLGLVLAELLVSARFREVHAYHVWWPHLEKTFQVAPGVMPGVSGETHFRVNSLGLRGDELDDEHDVRMLAVGGSTTECLFLDQEDAWPQIVQDELNRRCGEHRTWIGNAGKSGLNSRDHVVLVKHLLPQLEGIDRVILLMGVNDMTLRLAQDEGYDPLFLERRGSNRMFLLRSFQQLPIELEASSHPIERMALWRWLGRVKDGWLPEHQLQDDAGLVHDQWRAHRRQAAALRDALPDLSTSLEEYRRNAETIVDLCRSRGVEVLLLTQPCVWSEDLSPEMQSLLWLGGIGEFMTELGCDYYTVAALRAGLETYNRTLVAVAEERGVECLDLAAALESDEDAFYDDVHLNVAGSHKVAASVTEFLLGREPFRSTPRAVGEVSLQDQDRDGD